MSPFLTDASVTYRVERLQTQAINRRMARTAKAGAVHRANHPIKAALGNGLIALGARLVDPPPAVDHSPLDTAA